MNMKTKFVIQCCVCFVVSLVAGFGLLVLVYMLPTERIRYNVSVSVELIENDDIYHQWTKGYKNTQSGTYEDASLFLDAMYPGSGNVIQDAMNVPRLLYGDDNNEGSAVLLSQNAEGETHVVNYGRYWHGVLIFLKPLLYLFDLADIRIFTMILHMALTFLVILGFTKRNLTKNVWGFFVMLVMLNPVIVIECLCYSVDFILMLVTTLVMLYAHEKLTVGYRYYLFFWFMGIWTVYFSELHFTMAALGMALITYLLLSRESVKQLIKQEFLFSLMWGSGYVLFWCGKWVLAWIFTGYNYLFDAFQEAKMFTSDHATWEADNPSVIDRLYRNIEVYMKWPFVLLLLAVVIILVLYLVKRRERITKQGLVNMLPYFLIVLFPFAVLIALGNGYAYVHYWFTHKNLAISAFAGICMILQLTDRNWAGKE